MPRLSTAQLDKILTLQLLVAWAGEGRSHPARLGWWQTDLVDPEGGADLLGRLAPRTGAWAGLSLAREAAIRVDTTTRDRMSGHDDAITLYRLGFAIDEQVTDRLAWHRRSGVAPAAALPTLALTAQPFDRATLQQTLSAGESRPETVVEPVGRRLRGEPSDDPTRSADLLARALVPARCDDWATAWPMPFFRVGGGR